SVDFQSYFNNGDWHDSDYTSEQDLANDYEPQNVIRLNDLKRLVESVDLVKSYGGIINAKMDIRYLDIDWDYDTLRRKRLKQAIADYESIGGENVL
ncbi:MAG: hypothetical protein RSC68_34805, partial [Acinetobacter sp.]